MPWMNPGWLAASADRERAVGVLRAGFAEGRLSQDELDDRVTRAYSARTYGELWALTVDLPAGPFVPVPGPVAVVPQAAVRPSSWRPAAALVITALVIFTLAALITALLTAHAGSPVPYQQVNLPVKAQLMPDQREIVPGWAIMPGQTQQVVVLPAIVNGPGAPGGPPPGP